MNHQNDQTNARFASWPGENQWIDATTPAGMHPLVTPTANGGWAVAALVFFWPLAFVAFSQALSVPTLIAQGRIHEAHVASDSVARLGKISLAIGLVLIVGFVVLEVAVTRELASPLRS